ncbi:MAG: hypothetical protein WC264_00410 [Candidatus Paceibacterota bacterium]|jgi:hypothetical protein
MKQASLKLKSYAANVNIVNNYDIQKRILNIILLSLGVLAFCYVLILGNMVFNIIERRALDTDARSLSSEIGNLELQYLSVSDKVDLALAESMGFKEIKSKFATRKTLGYGSSTGESIGSIKLATNEL